MKAKKVLSGICAVVMFSTCAIVATGCSSSESAKESHVEQLQQGGMMIAGNKVHGISMLSTIIPAEDYEEYGIALAAESAQMITLEVSPSNATIKDIVWDLSWYDPSNSWIGSKLVGDYVTIQQQQDLISVSVTCLQDFGAAIKLTCTLTDGYGNEWTDSAMINYVIKPTGIESISIGGFTTEDITNVGKIINSAPANYSNDTTLQVSLSSDKDYTLSVSVSQMRPEFVLVFSEEFLEVCSLWGFSTFKNASADGLLRIFDSDIRYSGDFYLNALSDSEVESILSGTRKDSYYSLLQSTFDMVDPVAYIAVRVDFETIDGGQYIFEETFTIAMHYDDVELQEAL